MICYRFLGMHLHKHCEPAIVAVLGYLQQIENAFARLLRETCDKR